MNETKHCSLFLEMISDVVFAFQKYLKDQDSYLKTNIDNLKAIANAAEKLYLQNSEINKKTSIELLGIIAKYELKLSEEAKS